MGTHVQDFWTSRNKLVDGEERIGKSGRLWFDPDTSTIRVGNQEPGGRIISTMEFIQMHDTPDSYLNKSDQFVKVSKTDNKLVFSNIVDGGNF